jgi:hypothetical protein
MSERHPFTSPNIEGEVYYDAPPVDYEGRRARTAEAVAELVASLVAAELHDAQGQLFDATPYVQSNQVLPPVR